MATPPKCPSRLADRWVFWLDKWDSNNGQTVQSLADIGEADTARAFWNIFDANPVEKLPESCSLHVFKGQVRPEWEDKANINGGHFRFTPLPDQPNASPGRLWYNLVLGAIGNQFMLSSSVVGVGFTNKGTRKVVSVWVNTAEQSVVRALQADMIVHTGERFVSKFVAHQNIPRSDFTAQETVLHRRTQSAPSQYVSIDVGDDDEADANELSGSAGEKSASSGTLKRKAAPAPLDSTLAHSSNANDNHGRSKSEGVSRDIVPNVRPLGGPASNAPSASHSVRSSKPQRTSPPPMAAGGSTLPTPTALHAPVVAGGAPQRQESEWNWQDSHSTELRDSNSGVYPPGAMKAPTPMKEWADQWSPSLMNANRQPLDGNSNATSPGTATDVHTAQQHQLLQAANAQGGAHTESPMNLSRTQPQSAMVAAAADPYAPQPPPQPPHQEQQPFGSFPLQVHQQMSQHPPQQHQHQHAQHMAHNPYQPQPPNTYTHYSAPPPQLPGATAYPTQLPYVIVRQPVSHHSPPASDFQRAAPVPVPQRGAPRVPERNFPLRQGSESADRSSRSPPPRASVGSNPGAPGVRRDTPPPTSVSPPPSAAGGSADRRAQHTKSDAPPFLFKGWMFPSGLNRKERRRIMFSEDVNFAEYPGAVFKNESFPDGPCDEEGNPVAEADA